LFQVAQGEFKLMNIPTFVFFSTVLALSLLTACDPKREYPSPTDTITGDSSITYVKSIAPMIASRCGACHISAAQGGMSFAAYADVAATIDRIIIRAENGTMPPSGYLPLTVAQIDTLKKWRAHGKIQGSGTPAPVVPIDTTITYAQHISRLMTAHCGDCHIGEDQSGGVSLAAYADVVAAIDRIIGRTEAGTMPPASSDYAPLTKPQVDTLKIWKASGERQ
jgi:mono/diheme cytochrome c family protein